MLALVVAAIAGIMMKTVSQTMQRMMLNSPVWLKLRGLLLNWRTRIVVDK